MSSLLFNFYLPYSVSSEMVLKNACTFCYYLFYENQASMIFDIVFNFFTALFSTLEKLDNPNAVAHNVKNL